MFCTNCGTKLINKEKNCRNCGYKLEPHNQRKITNKNVSESNFELKKTVYVCLLILAIPTILAILFISIVTGRYIGIIIALIFSLFSLVPFLLIDDIVVIGNDLLIKRGFKKYFKKFSDIKKIVFFTTLFKITFDDNKKIEVGLSHTNYYKFAKYLLKKIDEKVINENAITKENKEKLINVLKKQGLY